MHLTNQLINWKLTLINNDDEHNVDNNQMNPLIDLTVP